MAGNLDVIRDAARLAIHRQFALPAIVLSAGGSAIGEAHVRLHSADSRAFGDLDREGYAFSLEGKTVLVFDTQEFQPAKNQKVNLGRGRFFNIEHRMPGKGERFVRCIAVEVIA